MWFIYLAISKLFPASTIKTFPERPTDEGVYYVWEGDSSFPYPYGRLEITYGSHNQEFIAVYKTTGDDGGVYTNVWRYGWQGWSGYQKKIYSTGYNGATDEWGQVNLAFATPYWDKILNIIPSNTNLMVLQCGYVCRVFAGSGLEPYVNQPIDMTIIYYI